MKRWYWLGLGFAVAAGALYGCGDGPVSTAAGGGTGGRFGGGGRSSTGGTGGQGGTVVPAGAGVGDACSDSMPCRAGLTCGAGAVCEPGHSLAQGDACLISPECQDGLQCVSGKCAPAGDGVEGDSCLTDAQCMSGLRCAIVGFAAQCAPYGMGDLGDACGSSLECFGGLYCSEGACAIGTPGLPFGGALWPGVECEAPPTEGPVKAYFEVPGASGAQEGDFFRLPFPNDARRSNGGLDLSGFPTPGSGLFGYDLVARYVEAVSGDSGFGAYGTVIFRFSGFIDIDSFSEDGVVHFVDITPNAAEYGNQDGHAWYYSSGRTPYVCDNWFGVRRPVGAPMVPGHTYAVYMTTGGKDSSGGDIERPQNLVSVLSDSAPADAALAAVHAAYQPFRDYLEGELIDSASVLNASVFTVAPVRDPMADVAEAIESLAAPTASDWVKCADGVTSPCDDGTPERACGAGTADYDEYHALVSLPVFQQGTAPYLTPEDGGGVVPSSNPDREDVCLSLTVPTGTMPAEGWPLVVTAHGTGGSFRSHVRPELAGALAAATPAFAVLGIDQVVHGPRRGTSTESPDNLFFNFQNPAAARGNPIQGAADQLSLAEFAATLDLSAADSGGDAIKVDPSKIFFFGHSQGSTEGSLALPYSDIYKAAVLSGNGASLMDALLTKTSPVDIKSVMPLALSDPTIAETNTMHPVLSLLQQWIDPGDPLNFARPITREPIAPHQPKHLFQTFGMDDTFSPPDTLWIFARAGVLPQVNPALSDLELPLVDAPVSGNVTVASTDYTLGVRQYQPSGSDGHFVVFDVSEANGDMVHFFETAAVGTPEIGQ